ncbi:hypothetical protein CERSUDRAFT_99299 [Gelatoporia subvermispora B]|uniref:Uncharacterized protein n=1 Tax=Ceriporiopsis subvermispora (strain B) TaxID=914234 RepID=M2PAM2_CERS8|nr:hypothetical protein CERSUDRAFT_99299 [Gelatoporia subvermispora B]
MRGTSSSSLSSTRGVLARSPRRCHPTLSRAISSAAAEAQTSGEKPPPARRAIPRLESFGDIQISNTPVKPLRPTAAGRTFKPNLNWLSVDQFSISGGGFAQRLAQRKQNLEAEQLAKAEAEAAQTAAEAKKEDVPDFKLSRRKDKDPRKVQAKTEATPTHADPAPAEAQETFDNLVKEYAEARAEPAKAAEAKEIERKQTGRRTISSRQKRAQVVQAALPTVELQTNLDVLFGTSSTTPAATPFIKESLGTKVTSLPNSIQRTLERTGGDYSRYSPLSAGTLEPEKITPVQRARLLFGRRREATLNQRQKALDVVHRLVPAGVASQASATL